jgi:UDP-4-amino-4,6-dideoxy-N-acetyl-beta-L-altrosamine N-acetyltransferase
VNGDLTVRALSEEDRWRLHVWRNSERIRSVSLDDEPIPESQHIRWFDRSLLERAGQFRIVEWQRRPVGLVQIEALDRGQETASWGCYLGDTNVPPGVGASLPLLGLGYGFAVLALRRMTAQVLGINANMLAIHRRLSIPVEGVLRRHVRRSTGEEVDAYLYGVHRDDWPRLRDRGLRLLPSHVRTAVATWTT